MKAKNWIIGLVAVVLAIGSAVGSAALPVTTYIRTKSAPTSSYTCTNVGQLCDTEGIYSCQINVAVFWGVKTVVGRRADCPTVPTLTHTSTTPIITALVYYDAD